MGNNQFYKGSLETIILSLLEENGRMYGYEMCRKVEELSEGGIKVTEAALYPALHKMEGKGMLTTTIENIGNRKRKYYAITEAGKTEWQQLKNEFEAYIGHMHTLLNLKPKWT